MHLMLSKRDLLSPGADPGLCPWGSWACGLWQFLVSVLFRSGFNAQRNRQWLTSFPGLAQSASGSHLIGPRKTPCSLNALQRVPISGAVDERSKASRCPAQAEAEMSAPSHSAYLKSSAGRLPQGSVCCLGAEARDLPSTDTEHKALMGPQKCGLHIPVPGDQGQAVVWQRHRGCSSSAYQVQEG